MDGVGWSGQLQIPVNLGQTGPGPSGRVTVGHAGKTTVVLEEEVVVLRGQTVGRAVLRVMVVNTPWASEGLRRLDVGVQD